MQTASFVHGNGQYRQLTCVEKTYRSAYREAVVRPIDLRLNGLGVWPAYCFFAVHDIRAAAVATAFPLESALQGGYLDSPSVPSDGLTVTFDGAVMDAVCFAHSSYFILGSHAEVFSENALDGDVRDTMLAAVP